MRHFLLALILFAGFGAFAQFKITGKVVTNENEPVSGASVVLEGTTIGTISDVNGNFLIDNLKTGNYVFKVSFLGYATYIKEFDLKNDMTLDINLVSLLTGIIVSPENKPVSNVSVSIEGSRDIPAYTNEKGEFILNANKDIQWLIVAPASDYKKKRVFVDSRKYLKIVVTPLDLSSNEDVITLLNQNVTIKDITSSFSNVNLGDVNHTITTSFDNYMQGRIPGLNVINQSGVPGSGAVTFLRGINSINASTQPLYIVDGAIMESPGVFGSVVNGYNYNPLLSVNPLDISDATVLKDAVYEAAYGSKASNGLVMIKTLDPSATETSFQIDLRRGLTLKPDRYIPQLNASQHKTLINELLFSSGLLEEDITEEYPNLYLEPKDSRFIDYQHNTNWQELIFDNATFTNFNLKVKGGDEIARYGLSFGYNNNNGIIKNTNYSGYNLRFVSLVNIFKWLRMDATVSFNTSNSSLKESGIIKETSPILTSLAKSPMLNPFQYDTEGKETTLLSEVDELGISNPMATIDNFSASSRNYHIITSLGLEADLGKYFFLKSNVGIFYNSLKEKIFMPNKGMEMYYEKEAYNVAKASTNVFEGFSNNTMLVFNKKIKSDHVVNSTTGFNVMTNKFQYDWGIAKNSHENDQYQMLQDGLANLREMGGQNRNWNWMSIYEKISYSYQDKYLFNGSLSFDGSSRIGKNATNTLSLFGQPFGLFYSAGLGWRISNESFLNNVSWLEELKLRLSAGRTGNDDIGESNASNYYRTLHYRETTGLAPATFPNYNLTYEFVDQVDAGVDLALWGNRLKMNFDVYKSTISNLLIYKPLKVFLGYDFSPENAGKMQNIGWDANLFVRLLNNRNFKWDIETTLSRVQNKVLEMPDNKFVTTLSSYELVNQVNEQVNSFYGYRFLGVYSTTSEAAGLVNNKGVPYNGGDAIFEDLSGPSGTPDGVINNYDKTIIGSPMPEFVGGLTNTFIYKNWSLTAFVNFVSGNEVFNYLRFKNESMTNLANQSVYVLNRWQYEGQKTEVPRAIWNDPIGNSAFSTRWIEDGSYIRIKNISLSYKIPHEFLAFKNAEFYISASNLFTFSNYLGYDPEFAYSYHLNQQGIDYGQMPQSRQFLVGIKIGL